MSDQYFNAGENRLSIKYPVQDDDTHTDTLISSLKCTFAIALLRSTKENQRSLTYEQRLAEYYDDAND